jgi:hypothetical protein
MSRCEQLHIIAMKYPCSQQKAATAKYQYFGACYDGCWDCVQKILAKGEVTYDAVSDGKGRNALVWCIQGWLDSRDLEFRGQEQRSKIYGYLLACGLQVIAPVVSCGLRHAPVSGDVPCCVFAAAYDGCLKCTKRLIEQGKALGTFSPVTSLCPQNLSVWQWAVIGFNCGTVRGSHKDLFQYLRLFFPQASIPLAARTMQSTGSLPGSHMFYPL